jgi:uncharacterized protein YkwD
MKIIVSNSSVSGTPPLVLGTLLAGMIIICTPSTFCLAAPEQPAVSSTHKKKDEASCLSPQETEMIRLVNHYRERRGLPPVPVSRSLVMVARLHALDLQQNRPDQGSDSRGMTCNMHSWSSRGDWKPGCYTNDHRNADLMRAKPREITGNVYREAGYEAVYWISSPPVDPQLVLEGWAKSPDHRALLFESGKWVGINFKALGVGVTDNFAVLWFGTMRDPLGTLLPCSTVRDKNSVP